jgi:hypothetical protein
MIVAFKRNMQIGSTGTTVFLHMDDKAIAAGIWNGIS